MEQPSTIDTSKYVPNHMVVKEVVSSHMLSSEGIGLNEDSSQAHERAKFFKKEEKRWHNDHIPTNTFQVETLSY